MMLRLAVALCLVTLAIALFGFHILWAAVPRILGHEILPQFCHLCVGLGRWLYLLLIPGVVLPVVMARRERFTSDFAIMYLASVGLIIVALGVASIIGLSLLFPMGPVIID